MNLSQSECVHKFHFFPLQIIQYVIQLKMQYLFLDTFYTFRVSFLDLYVCDELLNAEIDLVYDVSLSLALDFFYGLLLLFICMFCFFNFYFWSCMFDVYPPIQMHGRADDV